MSCKTDQNKTVLTKGKRPLCPRPPPPSPVSPSLAPVPEGCPGQVKGLPEGARGFSGSLQSPGRTLHRTPSQVALGLEGNSKKRRRGMSTGRSAWLAKASSLLIGLRDSSESLAMESYQDQQPLQNTCGKKKQRLREPDLNSVLNHLTAHPEKIGNVFGTMQSKAISSPLRLKCEFAITGLSALLSLIFRCQLRESPFVSSITDELVVENLAEPGRRPVYKLILKTHYLSFGAVMEAIDQLSSMNLEEVWILCNIGISISHMLRWLDRYPVNVEIKGASLPLRADRFWITSNIHPERWYPDVDRETMDALLRRVTLVEFQ